MAVGPVLSSFKIPPVGDLMAWAPALNPEFPNWEERFEQWEERFEAKVGAWLTH